jgi:hypothetical protein
MCMPTISMDERSQIEGPSDRDGMYDGGGQILRDIHSLLVLMMLLVLDN